MTKIKICGLSRPCDIDAVNELKPDYIGFVFWPKSRRAVTREKAETLKKALSKDISAVGVFIDEDVEVVAELVNSGIIDMAQLHGNEDDNYIIKLRELTNAPVIKAFVIRSREDFAKAENSIADYVLLDSGTGSGNVFDWSEIDIKRPYFLAGGLSSENVGEAINKLSPYAVDVSSAVESDGVKDKEKMAAFIAEVERNRL